ncbi:MAG: hypothetical protein COC00_011140 [Rhizobiales bacterium]|nr:hypothetical protein [Hyphomicrobiales bacterium]
MPIRKLFLTLSLTCSLLNATQAFAFESYEHSEIGREAFKSALLKLDKAKKGLSKKLLSSVHLTNGPEAIGAVANNNTFANFTFGDLVAIYGDYATSVEEVNNPEFAVRVNRLKSVVRGLGSNDLERDHSIALAINNPTHFSLRAAQSYVQWHRKALLIAGEKDRLWEALHYEALALHSFTDLYAFGHMHDDRRLTDQVVAWGEKNANRSSATSSIANLASKLMGAYVNFTHNAFNWKGAILKNIEGDAWRGFGDKNYRVVDSYCKTFSKADKLNCTDAATERQRQIIVHAASLSILDVLNSSTGKRVKLGKEYRAMCHLPVTFWAANKPIPPENQKAAIAQLQSAMKKQGRPIEKHGFDFSLGYLKFDKQEYRGNVNYIDYVKQNCGII